MKYLSSILVYGVGVHALYLVPLVGGLAFGYSKFSTEAQSRAQRWNKLKSDERLAVELRAKVDPQMQVLAFRRDLVFGDQYAAIGTLLSSVESQAGGDNLQRESLRKEPTNRFIIPLIKVPGEEFGITYSGRYGALQTASLTLETMRPNLILLSQTLKTVGQEPEKALLRSESTYLALIQGGGAK